MSSRDMYGDHPAPTAGPDWHRLPLSTLIDHIELEHHTYTRQVLERIRGLMGRVLGAHGAEHPELLRVADLVRELYAYMLADLNHEERAVFPLIRALARAESARTPAAPSPGAARAMSVDHQRAAALLAALAEASHDFTPPLGATTRFAALYRLLAELRRDLETHMALEERVLFPRARALEAALAAGR
jgi:regulator of cell morphogenesis and NO signaling